MRLFLIVAILFLGVVPWPGQSRADSMEMTWQMLESAAQQGGLPAGTVDAMTGAKDIFNDLDAGDCQTALEEWRSASDKNDALRKLMSIVIAAHNMTWTEWPSCIQTTDDKVRVAETLVEIALYGTKKGSGFVWSLLPPIVGDDWLDQAAMLGDLQALILAAEEHVMCSREEDNPDFVKISHPQLPSMIGMVCAQSRAVGRRNFMRGLMCYEIAMRSDPWNGVVNLGRHAPVTINMADELMTESEKAAMLSEPQRHGLQIDSPEAAGMRYRHVIKAHINNFVARGGAPHMDKARIAADQFVRNSTLDLRE